MTSDGNRKFNIQCMGNINVFIENEFFFEEFNNNTHASIIYTSLTLMLSYAKYNAFPHIRFVA